MLDSFEDFVKRNQKFFILVVAFLCIISAAIGVLMGLKKSSGRYSTITEVPTRPEYEIEPEVSEAGDESSIVLPSPVLPEVKIVNPDYIYYFESVYKKPDPGRVIIGIEPERLLEEYGGSFDFDGRKVDFFKLGNKKLDILLYKEMLAEP
ncbi:MAG: hypothetical protein DRP54_01450 [Spirochaetes bacterium]|nr:MAG: hypothetical protein DRP54_01450 [Spirochaetota bacterium]